MNMDKDELPVKKRKSRLEQLERRIQYCEEVAKQYERMFKQLEEKMRSFSDRANNIQAVYDYLTRVGSDLSVKNPHLKRTLNPIKKELPKEDEKSFELRGKFKFKAGDEVFYVDTNNQTVTYHIVYAVEIMDKQPRYLISKIPGYINEYKLFNNSREAEEKLDEWKRPNFREGY